MTRFEESTSLENDNVETEEINDVESDPSNRK